MDQQEIESFVRELTGYINSHIVGNGNTHIIKCSPGTPITEKEHAITLDMGWPEGMDEGIGHVMPTFYAEELLEEFPCSTAAYVAEVINMRMNIRYEEMVAMLLARKAMEGKGLDAYDMHKVTMTAMPCGTEGIPYGKFISRPLPGTGLDLYLRGIVHESPDDPSRVYLAPIPVTDGRDATDAEWREAEHNALRQLRLHYSMGRIEDRDTGKLTDAVCGKVEDSNNVYGYFYLSSPLQVWNAIIEESSADRIYIIPEGTRSAKFIIGNEKLRQDVRMSVMCRNMLQALMEASDAPVFVLDCLTMKVRPLEDGEGYGDG